MDIDAGTDTDTDNGTDTENGITDPDAASGSMMVTYTGNANTRNARPHVAMNNTEVGFKRLRGFILRTFFNKMFYKDHGQWRADEILPRTTSLRNYS